METDPALFATRPGTAYVGGHNVHVNATMPVSPFTYLRLVAKELTFSEFLGFHLTPLEWRNFMARYFRFIVTFPLGITTCSTRSAQSMWDLITDMKEPETLLVDLFPFITLIAKEFADVKVQNLDTELAAFLNFTEPNATLAGFLRFVHLRDVSSSFLVPVESMLVPLHLFEPDPCFNEAGMKPIRFNVAFDFSWNQEAEFIAAIWCEFTGNRIRFYLRDGNNIPFHEVAVIKLDKYQSCLNQDTFLTNPVLWWNAFAHHGDVLRKQPLTFEQFVQSKIPVSDTPVRITKPVHFPAAELDTFPGFAEIDPRKWCPAAVPGTLMRALITQGWDDIEFVVVVYTTLKSDVSVVSWPAFCDVVGGVDNAMKHMCEAFPGTLITDNREESPVVAHRPVEEIAAEESQSGNEEQVKVNDNAALVAKSEQDPAPTPLCRELANFAVDSVFPMEHGAVEPEHKKHAPTPIDVTPGISPIDGSYSFFDGKTRVLVTLKPSPDTKTGIHRVDSADISRYLEIIFAKKTSEWKVNALHQHVQNMIAGTVKTGKALPRNFYTKPLRQDFLEQFNNNNDALPVDPQKEYYIDFLNLQQFLSQTKERAACVERNVLHNLFDGQMTEHKKKNLLTCDVREVDSKHGWCFRRSVKLLTKAKCKKRLLQGLPDLTTEEGIALFWNALFWFDSVENLRSHLEKNCPNRPESWRWSQPEAQETKVVDAAPAESESGSRNDPVVVDSAPQREAEKVPSLETLESWLESAQKAGKAMASAMLSDAVNFMWGGHLAKMVDGAHTPEKPYSLTWTPPESYMRILQEDEAVFLLRYQLGEETVGHFVAAHALFSKDPAVPPRIFVYDSLKSTRRKATRLTTEHYPLWSLEYALAFWVQRILGQERHLGASVEWGECPLQEDGISCLWFALTMCRYLLRMNTVLVKNKPAALSLRQQLIDFLQEKIREHPEAGPNTPPRKRHAVTTSVTSHDDPISTYFDELSHGDGFFDDIEIELPENKRERDDGDQLGESQGKKSKPDDDSSDKCQCSF